MIELVKTPTSNFFYTLVGNSNQEMILCAPFIKKNVVTKILNTKKDETKLTIITSSNISNYIQKSSDLSAIRMLLEKDATVLNYQDLHAKIYLFDSSKALITSANLTNSGLCHNYEYGVFIDQDDSLMNQIEDDFLEMMDSKNSHELKLDSVDELEKTIKYVKTTKYSIEEVDGDNSLIIDDIDGFIGKMKSWKKDVFSIIAFKMKNEFTLSQMYAYKNDLQTLHPTNHFIEEKIRQILQYLRDMGLIKFTKSAHYKKLFSIKKD